MWYRGVTTAVELIPPVSRFSEKKGRHYRAMIVRARLGMKTGGIM